MKDLGLPDVRSRGGLDGYAFAASEAASLQHRKAISAVSFISPGGLCSEEDVPSESLESSMQVMVRVMREKATNVRALFPSAFALVDAVDTPAFSKLIARETQNQSRCPSPIARNFRKPDVVVIGSGPWMKNVDSALDRYHSVVARFGNTKRFAGIAGRRPAPATEGCEYLVRVYDGPFCDPFIEASATICEAGSYWIRASDLPALSRLSRRAPPKGAFDHESKSDPESIVCGPSLLKSFRNGKPIVESTRICVESDVRPSGSKNVFHFVSEVCLKGDCIAIHQRDTGSVSRDDEAAPGFLSCLRVGGWPETVEFQWKLEWYPTEICRFSADQSMIDTGSIRGLNGITPRVLGN